MEYIKHMFSIKTFLKAAFLILWCILLVNCSWFTPKETIPQVDLPNYWQESNTLITMDLANSPWWKQFDDPTLNSLIKLGLTNNNNVNIAKANLELANGELQSVKLSWLPSIKALIGYSTDPSLGNPLDFYGIMPGYFAFNIFKTFSRIKAAKLKITIAKNKINAVKLSLIGKIANSYYTYLAQVEQLHLLEDYSHTLSKMLSIQNLDYTHGISSDIEVDNLDEIVYQAQAQTLLIKSNIIKSQNALRYLLNQNPGGIAVSQDFAKLIPIYKNIAQAPAKLLANRPDVAIMQEQYLLAQQNIVTTKTSLLPAVNLSYFSGVALIDSNSNGEYAPIKNAYIAWSLDPSIFGDIKTLRGASKATYYGYIDTVRGALRDVADALTVNHSMHERYLLINKAYLATVDKYHLTYKLYQNGVISYAATLNDKANIDKLALKLNEVKLACLIATIHLYQVLGGGYSYEYVN